MFLGVKVPILMLHVLTVTPARWVGLPARRWSARLQRGWARCVARILGMRIEIEGTPPAAPFLLVSNHVSYVDIVLLMTLVDAAFVARADAADWPLFGRLCRTGGTIFLDRSRKRDLPQALDEIHRTLQQGRGVVLFPEGTTSDGTEVLPFRPSLLEVAARAGLPVSHATVSYATRPPSPPARLAVCWWGDMTFLPHLAGLMSLPGFEARIRFGADVVRETDRKRLALHLEQAVRTSFRS